MVMPDLPEFQAPDGTVINGRVQYERYCKEKGVTNPADFGDEWAKKSAERDKFFTPGARAGSEERKRVLAQNYKEFRTYGEYRQMIDNIGRRK
jgi:hypothetical protein